MTVSTKGSEPATKTHGEARADPGWWSKPAGGTTPHTLLSQFR
jgi:hypothetical protein